LIYLYLTATMFVNAIILNILNISDILELKKNTIVAL